MAAGWTAERLRGDFPFHYGNTVKFGPQVAQESAMTSFLVFAPSVLDRENFTGIDVSAPGHEGHNIIHIAGLYPVHDSEREYIDEHGLTEEFWKQGWDLFDVTRAPTV
ncbi:suppressor of fused domain protein [Actinomadura sp. HBU206391]|nr:suppressor of fused domain protein [Actinomadura sp. HBU206391]